jgi:hypothetical protein
MRILGVVFMVVGASFVALAAVVYAIRFLTPSGGLAAWSLWTGICAFVVLLGVVFIATGRGMVRQGSDWPAEH